MKTTFFSLFCLVFWGQLTAQDPQLLVISADAEPFYVRLDGKIQNAQAATTVHITDIPDGNYTLSIYFTNASLNAPQQYIELITKKITTFQVSKKDATTFSLSKVTDQTIGKMTLPANAKTAMYSRQGVNPQGIAISLPDDGSGNTNYVPNNNPTVTHNGASLDYKRAGNFKMVEFTDANGNMRLVPADSLPFLQNPTNTIANNNTVTNNNNTNSNSNNKSGTDVIGEKNERTEVVSYRAEKDGVTGQNVVMEVKDITTKTLVEKDGKWMQKTSTSQEVEATDFTCVPMTSTDFDAVLRTISLITTSRLDIATQLSKDKCFTPAQLEKIVNLLATDDEKATFANQAKTACASPSCETLKPHLDRYNAAILAQNEAKAKAEAEELARQNALAQQNTETNGKKGKTKKEKKKKEPKPKKEKKGKKNKNTEPTEGVQGAQ